MTKQDPLLSLHTQCLEDWIRAQNMFELTRESGGDVRFVLEIMDRERDITMLVGSLIEERVAL